MLPYTSSEFVVYEVGSPRGGWGIGGPIWADRSESTKAVLNGYHQIVGHTPVKEIITHKVNAKTDITFIDALNQREKEQSSPPFYELEIETVDDK